MNDIKIKKNSDNEGISINKLYPILAYEEKDTKEIINVQIYDNGRSITWKKQKIFIW